jgi:ABC-type Fe3+/spermidine/putrescine transport system ATPase subunit
MNAGAIVQNGAPAEVYRAPATSFAARFLGLNNLLPGHYAGTEINAAGTSLTRWETAIGPLYLAQDHQLGREEALLLIRPEATIPATAMSINRVDGTIIRRTFRGGTERILLRHSSGIELELDVEAGTLPQDRAVQIALRPDGLTTVEG